jgi:hypothetical protein
MRMDTSAPSVSDEPRDPRVRSVVKAWCTFGIWLGAVIGALWGAAGPRSYPWNQPLFLGPLTDAIFHLVAGTALGLAVGLLLGGLMSVRAGRARKRGAGRQLIAEPSGAASAVTGKRPPRPCRIS